MKSEEKISGTLRLLKGHYWGNIIVLALLLLLILYGVLPFFSDPRHVSVALERYAIMIPILAIPFSLKYFAHQIKKAPRPVETTAAIRVYKRASYLRLYIISLVALTQIVLFGYSGNMSFFWLTMVLFVVFLFCKPSRGELTEMMERPDKETETTAEKDGETAGK